MANTFKRLDKLSLENATIINRNFSGAEREYNGRVVNREGDRNFCVVIDEDLAEKLSADGWNVKTRLGEEGDAPEFFLPVAVKYSNYPPKIFTDINGNVTLLDEENISDLDDADIISADMIINPSPYDVNGKSGIKAYCKTMYVSIQEDPFAAKHRRQMKDDEDF